MFSTSDQMSWWSEEGRAVVTLCCDRPIETHSHCSGATLSISSGEIRQRSTDMHQISWELPGVVWITLDEPPFTSPKK